MISISTFKENADNEANIKLPPSETLSTRCRPHVSARKPQKWELITMPEYPAEFSNPC